MNDALRSPRRGTALVVALVTLLVVTLIAATALESLVATQRQLRRDLDALQAAALADAAAEVARTRLAREPRYTGETWEAPWSPGGAWPGDVLTGGALPGDAAAAEIRVEPANSPAGHVRVTIVARLARSAERRATVQREYFMKPAAPAAPEGEQE